MKYLGGKTKTWSLSAKDIQFASTRLCEIAESMGDTLIADLSADMKKTVLSVDEDIQFLADASPDGHSRRDAIVHAQAVNYPVLETNDPIASWQNRAELLARETMPHAALNKYCQFMQQTEALRSRLFDAAVNLSAYIDSQVGAMREEEAFRSEDST